MAAKMSTEEISTFRALRKHLIELDEQEQQEMVNQALQKAGRAAAILKQNYEVEHVYLYGSLAWGGFNASSDIDLFLIGFKGNYWRACSEVEAITAPIKISLACEEDCVDSLRNKVLWKGVEL